MFLIALIELVLCWLAFMAVFWIRDRKSGKPPVVKTAPAAKWGLALQGLAIALAWSSSSVWRDHWPAVPLILASMVLGPVSVFCAWLAARELGKQWRIQAALIANHQLITTGPYGIVRHPIYASLLGMFLATALLLAPWPRLLVAVIIFVIGTEIRIRAEERLLSSGFGTSFNQYKARVSAYIPFVR